MNEDWHVIPGFEGFYSIRLDGTVKRLAGSINCPNERILKHRISASGYLSVNLSKNGIAKECSIHRLLMRTFVSEPPSPTHEVNHKDGNKLNNALSNLEWVTPSENIRHADATGLRQCPKGERVHSARLTAEKVMEIRKRFAAGESGKVLAPEFGVSEGTIRDIGLGYRWKHLPVLDNYERGKHFRKLTRSNVAEIRYLRKQGWTMTRLAKKFGVSSPTIVLTVNGKYHAD